VILLIGIGVAVCFPALMTLAMSGATPEDAGLASGLINTTAQVGGALGLALLATVSTTHTRTLLERGESQASALTSGYHVAFLIGAALVVAAIVVAITVIEPVEQAAEHAPEQASYSEAA
jgi:MFS family permease